MLVESLPRKYRAKAQIPGALNISHDRVEALAPTLLPDKYREVVVYCASTPCRNSGVAAKTLTDFGYSKVLEYAEGKTDRDAAGYPLERQRKSR
ncbi:MAG: rhodanese-like domain-containing protein [Gammaproteobacteria bacterium]|nr:rhodanese-like domain-containing protein [Gammaproteobacteria bacterium]